MVFTRHFMTLILYFISEYCLNTVNCYWSNFFMMLFIVLNFLRECLIYLLQLPEIQLMSIKKILTKKYFKLKCSLTF
jgi:hypothetical protein